MLPIIRCHCCCFYYGKFRITSIIGNKHFAECVRCKRSDVANLTKEAIVDSSSAILKCVKVSVDEDGFIKIISLALSFGKVAGNNDVVC